MFSAPPCSRDPSAARCRKALTPFEPDAPRMVAMICRALSDRGRLAGPFRGRRRFTSAYLRGGRWAANLTHPRTIDPSAAGVDAFRPY